MADIGELRLREFEAATALAGPILQACKDSWEEEWIKGLKNKDNCSGFVKSVAGKLGVPLNSAANADQIVDEIAASWTKIADPLEAWRKAITGSFVLAGLKSSDHARARNNGHVVVITDGKLYRQKYPPCWGGSIGSAQSQGDKSVGEVWGPGDRDNIGYYLFRGVK